MICVFPVLAAVLLEFHTSAYEVHDSYQIHCLAAPRNIYLVVGIVCLYLVYKLRFVYFRLGSRHLGYSSPVLVIRWSVTAPVKKLDYKNVGVAVGISLVTGLKVEERYT